MTDQEKLSRIEKLITENIEVHTACCCGEELFGEVDDHDSIQTAHALLVLFEDGVFTGKNEMVVKTKELLEKHREVSAPLARLGADPLSDWENSYGLDQTALQFYFVLFEDGLTVSKREMAVKVKRLLHGTIMFYAVCDSCEEEYQSWSAKKTVWVEDSSVFKAAEEITDLLWTE